MNIFSIKGETWYFENLSLLAAMLVCRIKYFEKSNKSHWKI